MEAAHGRCGCRKSPLHLEHGLLAAQEPPLKPKETWSFRVRLQLADKVRDLALFNLAADGKLRGCDLVFLWIGDVYLPTPELAQAPMQGSARGSSRIPEAVGRLIANSDPTTAMFPSSSTRWTASRDVGAGVRPAADALLTPWR